jgi:dGTPase
MVCRREELEQQERQRLAPYAQFSSASRGRQHDEPPPLWRTHYQRDRDRIIHSRAFRRLEYKTQVFLNGTGDHLRTRLTHTIEVAAIARNIARALRLNEDLAEAIALAHDLGHSPFGHTGEEVLNRLMHGRGGFEHNRQSLRVVEQLEHKYPGFAGLNLSWEVREGLAKHRPSNEGRADPSAGPTPRSPSLEAQVADLADEIAYYSHDLDDGLDAGLLSEPKLWREVLVWRQAAEGVTLRCAALPGDARRFFIIRCIIDRQVHDVVESTAQRLAEAAPACAEDARQHPAPLIGYSEALGKLNLELRGYLYANLYYNPTVHEPNARAAQMLEALFNHYLAHPEEMGDQSRRRLSRSGLHRAACDHLAGMTDRYVVQEYRRLLHAA